MRNITPSSARTSALVKYLLALGKASRPRESGAQVDVSSGGDEYEGLQVVGGKSQQPPSAAYRRLHLLHVVHDVLCFLTVKLKDPAHSQGLACDDLALRSLKGHAGIFMQLAACKDGPQHSSSSRPGFAYSSSRDSSSSTFSQVQAILDIWERIGVFSKEKCADLRASNDQAANDNLDGIMEELERWRIEAAVEEQKRKKEETKWIVPARHGVPNDPTAPWHELPATNGLYMKRTQGEMRAADFPQGGYPLQNAGREADDDMKKAVTDLYKDALRCFDPYIEPDEVKDVDALGNIVWKDPNRPTRNHWGFSYEGLAKKKASEQMASEQMASEQAAEVGKEGDEHDGDENDANDEQDEMERPAFGFNR